MDGKGWGWVGKYVIVIIAALLLGVALGNLALFKSATLGNPRLTAARLAEFIAHMAALSLLWSLGWQAAQQMRDSSERLNGVATILVALVSLLITATGYVVLANFIGPFVSRDVMQMVNWLFILGVFGAAAWFIFALFAGADDLMAAVRDALAGKREV
ncbi:hypothetical protein [Noviherbaspirillum massiliense]|uniref:hypothetical protein n=1 Tax=Noviherbaspirillum massiliense TaxID=1465823 RepID=UPI0002D52651|nr:hypothetical protein [Noviherbaspirillum massiliense]